MLRNKNTNEHTGNVQEHVDNWNSLLQVTTQKRCVKR